MKDIKNIYCVGRNYKLHAEELGNAVPTTPMIFSKPTHALAEANGQEVVLPGGKGEVHFETEFVIHLAKPYEKGMKLEEVIDEVALGLDLTLRDVQNELKKKGHPWLLAKGFRNSAIITEFIKFPGEEAAKQTNFSLRINQKQVQNGNIQDMIFDLPTVVEYVNEQFGLGAGDIIYTGTPAGVGPLHDGDVLELLWGDTVLGSCNIKLV